MSTDTPDTTLPEEKDDLKNPRLVNIDDVNSVLGKGVGALHLRSGYGSKNFPTFFEYGAVTMDEVASELGKYKTEPKVFQGAHNAAEYIRDNSVFTTDTYVLQLPGDIFVVYQLSIIQQIRDSYLKKMNTSYRIEDIIRRVDLEFMDKDGNLHPNMRTVRNANSSPYDARGFRRPEWDGFDDTGRPLEPLSIIDASPMNSRDELRIIHELPIRFREPEILMTIPSPKKEFINHKIPKNK